MRCCTGFVRAGGNFCKFISKKESRVEADGYYRCLTYGENEARAVNTTARIQGKWFRSLATWASSSRNHTLD